MENEYVEEKRKEIAQTEKEKDSLDGNDQPLKEGKLTGESWSGNTGTLGVIDELKGGSKESK